MDAKLKSTLSKIHQERARGDHARAAKRAGGALVKYPDSVELHREAIDASLEAAESLQAIQFIKSAFARLPGQRSELTDLARERTAALGDAVVGKFLLDEAIRRRELREARSIAGEFADRTVRDLLQRTRMKRTTLVSAAHGGHSVSDETMTNTLCEAILCARLGRPEEAATAAGQALDSSAEEADALVALLEDLLDENPGCARAGFVLSRCLSSRSRHSEACERLTGAVRIDPELGPDALDLLRDVGDGFEETPLAIERALLQVLLITGEFDRAAQVARPWLQRSDDDAHAVVDAIAEHTSSDGDINDLHILLLDAAAQTDRMPQLQQTLVALAGQPENHASLLQWLDSNEERVFQTDVELLRAQLLIDNQRHQDAARTLKALCVASPADIARVGEALATHRDDHPALADLAEEINAPRDSSDQAGVDIATPTPAPTADAEPVATSGGFEVFENQEFRFTNDTEESTSTLELEDVPTGVTVGESAPAEGFNIYDGSDILGSGTTGPRPKAPEKSIYNGERRPLDKETAGILWEEEGDDAPSATIDDPPAIDEGFVRNVADRLYMSGAATFFHIDKEVEDATDYPPPGPESEPEPEPERYEDRFSRFLDGHLDDEDIVELMEEAASNGRTEELGQLIDFSPSTEAHALRRGLCGAEYELMLGRPARALEHLKLVRNIDMSEEHRKDTWLKTVSCQRKMQDFDAAHQTMLQLVALYPDCPKVAELARQTYREYLQNQCAEAPMLEKVTSLNGDT